MRSKRGSRAKRGQRLAESRVASGRDGVASTHVSSAAAHSLERPLQERFEAHAPLRAELSTSSLPDLATLLGRGLKQALHAVSFLQVPQEVFLSLEELGADMAPANLDLGQLRLVFAHLVSFNPKGHGK